MNVDDPQIYKSQKFFRSNKDVEDIYKQWDALVSEQELADLSEIVQGLVDNPPSSPRELESALLAERKKRHCSFRKAQLLHVYMALVARGDIAPSPSLQRLLVKKSSKSQSGVLVITVLTSPYPRFGDKVPNSAMRHPSSNPPCPDQADGQSAPGVTPSHGGPRPASPIPHTATKWTMHFCAFVALSTSSGAKILVRVELLLLSVGAGPAQVVPARRAGGQARQREPLRSRAATDRPRRHARDERTPRRQDRAPRPRRYLGFIPAPVPGMHPSVFTMAPPQVSPRAAPHSFRACCRLARIAACKARSCSCCLFPRRRKCTVARIEGAAALKERALCGSIGWARLLPAWRARVRQEMASRRRARRRNSAATSSTPPTRSGSGRSGLGSGAPPVLASRQHETGCIGSMASSIPVHLFSRGSQLKCCTQVAVVRV
eukprot:1219028-Pleurochrysis_carterae.AAC.6